MPVAGAFVLPHPPIIRPEVGRGEEKKIQNTADACKAVAKRIAEIKPETIVLISPHSTMYSNYFHISPGPGAEGNLGRFGAHTVSVKVRYDTGFVTALQNEARQEGIPAGTQGERDAALDHGTVIPLGFINECFGGYKTVRIGLSGLSAAEHYRLGMCIARVAERTERNTVIVASGDLSHRVRAEGPYGYSEEGPVFDREVTEALSEGDFLRILNLSPELAEKAGECGLRSITIMAGALDGRSIDSELLSYEATFGVGYGVAVFIPAGINPDRRLLKAHLRVLEEELCRRREQEDAYVRLARLSLEHYIKTGKNAAVPQGLPGDMNNRRAGVFVSLKKNGCLRGCIGTIIPVTGSVAEEILRNAVSAGAEDPRFDPVRPEELPELAYSVDVLSPPEPIPSSDMLDVTRYGVIVTSGRRRGLLLPNLEGVDTVAKQLSITLQKAGIQEDEAYTLERFEVVRHH